MSDTTRIREELTAKYGEEISDKLFAYIDMVLERNRQINLTAVRDRDEAVVKHLADSLAVSDIAVFAEAERIIDVGTGAGFPGALLAIAYPEKEFVLLDSTLKRLRIIDEFADALGISNLTTVHARAEEISNKPGFAESFDICVSRAVANLSKLSGWCLPFVRRGGHFISYKGENYQDEIDDAARVIKKYKGRLERVVEYRDCPEEISGHVLLVIKKL